MPCRDLWACVASEGRLLGFSLVPPASFHSKFNISFSILFFVLFTFHPFLFHFFIFFLPLSLFLFYFSFSFFSLLVSFSHSSLPSSSPLLPPPFFLSLTSPSLIPFSHFALPSSFLSQDRRIRFFNPGVPWRTFGGDGRLT